MPSHFFLGGGLTLDRSKLESLHDVSIGDTLSYGFLQTELKVILNSKNCHESLK